MSDIFISYSRLDKEFVGNLRDALAIQKQDVWIDWESIPPSQAWWSEIQKGISKSNNFVIIISPNSMGSPICQLEIEYAQQLGKRIIPVLYKEFKREEAISAIAMRLAHPEQDATRSIWGIRQPHAVFDDNDSELKRINYFFFRPEDDFEAKFAELFTIIRTDYAYKEQHTTLELRAMEWEKRGQDASFLLLDNELTQAKIWLDSAMGKKPFPTNLHRVYIRASEKRTQQLQTIRRASIIGSTIAVFTTLFAIISSIIGLQSTQNMIVASTQLAGVEPTLQTVNTQVAGVVSTLDANKTQVAITVNQAQQETESLRLANLSQELFNNPSSNLETASLLAIKALRQAYTPQADKSLVSALDKLATIKQWDYNGIEITLSPNGVFVGISNYGDTVDLLNIQTGEITKTFYMPNNRSVAFSPDGKSILAGGCGILNPENINLCQQGKLILWDVETAQPIQTFNGHTASVTSIAFSPDGETILSGSGDKTLQLWDVASGDVVHVFEGHTEMINSVAFSPDGKTIISGAGDGTMILWDVASGDMVRLFEGHSVSVTSVAFSPDGKTILSGSYDTTIRWWNARTGDLLNIFVAHTGTVSDVIFMPNSIEAISSSAIERTIYWDLTQQSNPRTYQYPQTKSIKNFVASTDGSQILLQTTEDNLVLWDFVTQDMTTLNYSSMINPSVSAISADSHYLLSLGEFNTLVLSDLSVGKSLGVMRGGSGNPIQVVSFSPDNTLAVSGGCGRPDTLFSTGLCFGGEVIVWDIQTQTAIHTFRGHRDFVTSVAFSPKGNYMASGSRDGSIIVWDLDTQQAIAEFSHYSASGVSVIQSVAFSPDQTQILSASTANTLVVWDIATQRLLHTYKGHVDGVGMGKFSPDGKTILSSSRDGTLRLWDVATEKVLRIIPETLFTTHLSWINDGKQFVAVSSNLTVKIWDTQYQDFITYACQRIVRDFTLEEREDFSILDKEPTCPAITS